MKHSLTLCIIALVMLLPLHITSQQSANPNSNLSFTRLTGGLNVPQFKSGRSDFVMNDINDDGHVDLLSIGDHGSPGTHQNGIMVWFNDGQGNFTFYQTGNFGYGGIAVGDVNNDGLKDVGYSMHHNYSSTSFGDQLIEAALGNGTGMNWTPYDQGLATNGEYYGMFGTDLGDVNNNGLLDLVSIAFGSGPGFHVYLNQGDGSWVPSFGLMGNNSDCLIQFADLNNDGYLDFIAGHALGTAYFGDGNGSFTNNDTGLPYYGLYSSRLGISVGDVNNDGSSGLAFINNQGGVEVWEFDQANDFWVNYSGNLPTSGTFQRTQLFDMNADGYTDVMAYGNRTFQLWLGNGQGDWTSDATFQTDFPSGSARAFRVGGDLNQNGHGDIVILTNEGTWITNQNKLYVYAENTVPLELWIRNLYPKGHEKFHPGSVRFIEWASAVPGGIPGTVKIEISASGPDGPFLPVADNLPNNGKYQWTIPNYASEECYLKYTITTQAGSASFVTGQPFHIIGEPTEINVKVFLEGPFNGQEMETALNTAGHLPLQQPFNVAPWYYTGNESVTAIPSPDIVDWALVELRETDGDASSATSATRIARAAVFLLNDGLITAPDGMSLPAFETVVIHNLFIVIHHRNHLSIMASTPAARTDNLFSYDFSSGFSQVFGGHSGYKQLTGSIFGMAGGDGSADGQVNNTDKIDIWDPAAGQSGYVAGDFDMDGHVANSDKNDVWAPNSGMGTQVPQ